MQLFNSKFTKRGASKPEAIVGPQSYNRILNTFVVGLLAFSLVVTTTNFSRKYLINNIVPPIAAENLHSTFSSSDLNSTVSDSSFQTSSLEQLFTFPVENKSPSFQDSLTGLYGLIQKRFETETGVSTNPFDINLDTFPSYKNDVLQLKSLARKRDTLQKYSNKVVFLEFYK